MYIYILKYLSLLCTVQYINFQLPPKHTLHSHFCTAPDASDHELPSKQHGATAGVCK